MNATHKKGFTLVETLVVIFIFSILMMGVTLLVRNIFYISGQQTLVLGGVDQARIALANFTNEIRNAANGNDGSYPLNTTSSTTLVFFSTYGATGTNVNRIRYFKSGSNLNKGIIIPSGSPATYNLGSETISSVITNIATSTTPLFSYYDDSYAGTSSPMAEPININNVNFVQINGTIYNQDIRNSTSTFTFTIGATMRNLKTNLGN